MSVGLVPLRGRQVIGSLKSSKSFLPILCRSQVTASVAQLEEAKDFAKKERADMNSLREVI